MRNLHLGLSAWRAKQPRKQIITTAQRPVIMSQELCLVMGGQRREAMGFCRGGSDQALSRVKFVQMDGIWGGGREALLAEEPSTGKGLGEQGRLRGAVLLGHSRVRRRRGR